MSQDLQSRFDTRPHHTLLSLALPAMGSLIAEPLAALIDTAFVGRLGATATAGLGASTLVLFATVWIFNFLNVGTQTEVARAYGAGDRSAASAWARLAIALALGASLALALVLALALEPVAAFMSTDPDVQTATKDYLRVRVLGVPALLVTTAACGALRGLSQMRLPLLVTALSAGINVLLDPLLIFGWGPIPAWGMSGAATATVLGQYAGCGVALYWVRRLLPRLTDSKGPQATAAGGAHRIRRLLTVGGDMIVRTGSLLLFLLLATRTALHVGPEAGAAHQAVRQVWVFSAFLMDAFAASAHSLVAYFLGRQKPDHARRVVGLSLGWSLGVGTTLGLLFWPAGPIVSALLVPTAAQPAFYAIWWICALAQPLNALSFLTDGVHMGTGEYAYLRKAMLVAAGSGIGALLALPTGAPDTLVWTWVVMLAFLCVRGTLGVLRIFPGYGPVWGSRRALHLNSARADQTG